MEESEKRKEILRAMRMEAARAESSNRPEALPGPGSLANPLAETPGPLLVQEESHAAPRFDYYTDPMSAFSANKRRNNPRSLSQHNYPATNPFPYSTSGPVPSVSGARNLETSSSPHAYQWRSPHHTMYQPHAPQPNLAPCQSQGITALPSPMFEGVPPRAGNGPNFHRQYYNAPSNCSPCFSPRQGSPHWWSNSTRLMGPGPTCGRGGAQGSVPGGSPSLSRSGGRGVGFRGRGYGAGKPIGPEQFYHESMIEDPWKDKVAVVWTPVGAPPTSSWMPQSVRSKKPRVSESSNKFSGLNLAEFLAATFHEAATEAETTLETGE